MSDVKLSNGVRIDSSSLKMGIDLSNQLASGSGVYTATQNCWVRVYCWGTPTSNIVIDNISYDGGGTNGNNYDNFHTFFLSKGQTITYSSHSWRAFGTK